MIIVLQFNFKDFIEEKSSCIRFISEILELKFKVMSNEEKKGFGIKPTSAAIPENSY